MLVCKDIGTCEGTKCTLAVKIVEMLADRFLHCPRLLQAYFWADHKGPAAPVTGLANEASLQYHISAC